MPQTFKKMSTANTTAANQTSLTSKEIAINKAALKASNRQANKDAQKLQVITTGQPAAKPANTISTPIALNISTPAQLPAAITPTATAAKPAATKQAKPLISILQVPTGKDFYYNTSKNLYTMLLNDSAKGSGAQVNVYNHASGKTWFFKVGFSGKELLRQVYLKDQPTAPTAATTQAQLPAAK